MVEDPAPAADPALAPDDALRALTGYSLYRATSAAMIRYKQTFARFGLRRTTFSCLCLIVARPGLRQSQLGEALAIERPNLGQIIDDLLKAGLIDRATSQTDRRAYALTPTQKGRALLDKAMEAVRALDEEVVRGLGKEEISAFRGALGVIETNAVKTP